MVWAMAQPIEPITKLVLICLGNYTGMDGNCAFPSNATLMADSSLSERAIRIHIRKLETMGLVRRGNPAFAAAYINRKDRLPYVYNLVMERGACGAPRESTGGTAEPHGGHMTAERGACGAPNPKDLSVGKPKSVENAIEEEFKQRFGALLQKARIPH